MNTDEFRRAGKQMIDYVADYLDNARDRQVTPDVQRGYLQKIMPDRAPKQGDTWDALFADLEKVLMPGVDFFFHFIVDFTEE